MKYTIAYHTAHGRFTASFRYEDALSLKIKEALIYAINNGRTFICEGFKFDFGNKEIIAVEY